MNIHFQRDLASAEEIIIHVKVQQGNSDLGYSSVNEHRELEVLHRPSIGWEY